MLRPVCLLSVLSVSFPSALARSLGAISSFGPVSFIRAVADPGLGDAPMSGVLQFFYDVAEAAAQHASGRGPAEQTAQSSGEEVIQAATTGLGAGGCAAWLAAEQPAEDIAEPTVRTAGGHGAAAWRQSARPDPAPPRDGLANPA